MRSASTAPRGTDRYDVARRMFESGDMRGAATVLYEVVSACPDDFQTKYLLGLCQYHQENFQEAERCFREVLSSRANHHTAAYYLGLVLERQSQPREALEAYRHALSVAPEASPNRAKIRQKLARLTGTPERPRNQAASPEAIPAKPPPSTRPHRVRRGIRKFFIYVSHIIACMLILPVGVGLLLTELKMLPESRAFPGGPLLIAVLATCGVLGFVLARRYIRQSDKKAESKGRVKRAAEKIAVKRRTRRRGQTFPEFLGSAILWIFLLVVGGGAGWFIGSAGEDEMGGVIGAIVGVLVSQGIQASLIKRRR